MRGLGLLLALAVLGAALPGPASAQGPNLTALLPAPEEAAPYRLSPVVFQSVSASAIERSGCDATPVDGSRENLGLQSSSGAPPLPNQSVARILIYRFDTVSNASIFMNCVVQLVKDSRRFTQRPVSYGDQGFIAETSPEAPRGASILFRKGAFVVSVDALDNSFESAAAHAFARSVGGRLDATAPAPAKSPGFEAAAALAGLAAAFTAGLRGRAGRP